MKNILVPIDFSECSKMALNTAIKTFENSGVTIHILHIIELPNYYNDMFDEGFVYLQNELEFKKNIERELYDFIKNIDFHGLRNKSKIIIGSVYDEITNYSNQNKIDLLVVGSKGVSGLKEVIIGSNAEKIVRYSESPVMVVKKKLSKQLKNIVFASTFSEESIAAYKKVAPFIDNTNSNLHLLKVITPKHFEETEVSTRLIKEFKKATNTEEAVETIYNAEFLERGIDSYAKKINADLLILPTHGRKGLKRLYAGSITEHVVNHTELPVLTVKIENQ